VARVPLAFAVACARTAGTLSRRLGKGGGTSAPGRVLLGLRPSAVGELAARLSDGAAVVSATNGKTTTSRLLGSCIAAQGWSTVANRAGANLFFGVATALLDHGVTDGTTTFGLFEVDEFALPSVVDQVAPRVVLLMNVFRDQLDRYGELESILDSWAQMISRLPTTTTLVLNGDDPAIAALDDGRHPVVWFGLDDPSVAHTQLAHAADSIRCRKCAHDLDYTWSTVGHMGEWKCPQCGAHRPRRDVTATRVDLVGVGAVRLAMRTPHGRITTEVALPGLHNAYNVVAATAAALALGVEPEIIGAALADTHAAFGRAERVEIDGKSLVLLLAKNPAGANVTIQTVQLDPAPLHLLVSLNDRTADGRDVSWIWDVDYELLLPRIAHLTVTGDRAYELALRFVYAGFPRERIHIELDVHAALDTALDALEGDAVLYVLPTYTAMLELRSLLVNRGALRAYWEHA
jgi:lipid II isoglutaminyl synthase (glutamine-hydrolysing)